MTDRSNRWTGRGVPSAVAVAANDLIWAFGSICALHQKPFDAALLIQQYPGPHSTDTLIRAGRALGFRVKRRESRGSELFSVHLPCLVVLRPVDAEHLESVSAAEPSPVYRLAMLCRASGTEVALFHAGNNTGTIYSTHEFLAQYAGTVVLIAPQPKRAPDPDSAGVRRRSFGFRWFLPELLKHRKVWGDVLAASLIIQILALATPLFTQVVIDKVVVHRTQSTLVVIAIGMTIFLIFSSLLTWVRQYLVLHTGNRVDAVLGAAVFEHLFNLPPRYFEQRPTGVIAARLRGVENSVRVDTRCSWRHET